MLVFWILVPIFVALGLYLLWYARRRRAMLEAFAKEAGLRMQPRAEASLEARLERCFSLQQPGLVRSFGQLASLVKGDPVWIFRSVELLDLNPHGQAQSTHFNRIAALFPVPDTLNSEFFLLDKNGQARSLLPGSAAPDTKFVAMVNEVARSSGARHPLSVTCSRGSGLIYFEPFVVGGETLDDVKALYRIAQGISQRLG
ncbi:hypothetical protein ACQUQP_12330 [Marinobacterium sp. YM272]|uniref:hypothetical protein n=1 Tax=Marinobacterium sp. YM272 TaxID=3421654 RepID=UPI003D7F6DA5